MNQNMETSMTKKFHLDQWVRSKTKKWEDGSGPICGKITCILVDSVSNQIFYQVSKNMLIESDLEEAEVPR